MRIDAAPTTHRCLAAPPTAGADVLEDPRQGPPGRAPPLPPSNYIVVGRRVAIAIVGGEAVRALPDEECHPGVIVVRQPLGFVPLLRREVVREAHVRRDGVARVP
jgi:hypothetical protein